MAGPARWFVRSDALSTSSPDISVVIPTRSRPEALGACLAALAQQHLATGCFEAIVVVDGAGAPAPDVVTTLGDRLQLTVVVQPPAGPAAARNYGARLARGALLAFTDDDCRPEPQWLPTMLDAAASNPGCALGGPTCSAVRRDTAAEASQMLLDYFVFHSNRVTGVATFLPSNNLVVPADRFRALGGFAVEYQLAAGEDRDFCRRWIATGDRLVEVPEALVWHHHRLTPGGFWRQQYRYGRGAWRYHRRSQAGRGPDRRNGAAFYLRLLTHPVRVATKGRRVSLLGLFALSQAAVAVGYWREALRNRLVGVRRDPASS